MQIRDLMNGCSIAMVQGSAETQITDLTEDSRRVQPGALFVARRGACFDGRCFVTDALRAGAAAILCDDPAAIDAPHTTVLVTDDLPQATADLAERFFGRPSQHLRVIGITGTNGKTTTAWLVRHLLNEAGHRCGLMGTIVIDDGRVVRPAALTTPSAIDLSRSLSRMVDNGCTHAVIEVSSHALAQKRAAGLEFAIGVFTNLSGDHLDYHPTMDDYAAAKALLFAQLPIDGVAVLNADDVYAARMIEHCSARVVRCTTKRAEADCRAVIGSMDAMTTCARLIGPWGEIEIDLPLAGAHNVANALQATAVAHALGIEQRAIAHGLRTASAPPGRLEPVATRADEITVLVDYAHTDAALDNVLCAVRPLVPEDAALWVVFGCGGDRDRSKRPRMAAVACALADRIMITSDNPRTEDPLRIIDEIVAGVSEPARCGVVCLVDRAEAIQHAIAAAGDGDVILIAGKGHEDYQIIGTTKRPFDDRIVARRALEMRRRAVVSA